VVKGPAADATDAPQPWGLFATLWWRWLVFFVFPSNGAPVEWNWQGKTEVLGEKTCPSSTLSTTNPTWTDPGSNPGPRGERPATNRLSRGTACGLGWFITEGAKDLPVLTVGLLELTVMTVEHASWCVFSIILCILKCVLCGPYIKTYISNRYTRYNFYVIFRKILSVENINMIFVGVSPICYC
jgi:hypothetical protein